MNEEFRKQFAQAVRDVANPPTPDVLALGHMLRDWLESVVADAGTSVDTGAGMGFFDLWLRMGGKSIHVQIKERA